MSLVRDLTFVQQTTAIPALREVVREALIRALFNRDERALPKDVVRVLRSKADVILKVRDEIEVREAVRTANGEQTTVNLGRPADEFHYYRQQLRMAKDQVWGVNTRPALLQTYDWIVPPQGGVLLDLSGLDEIEVDGVNYAAKVGAGARWKALYDRAVAAGMLPAVFPSVPLDFAIGDGVVGDARFRSFHSTWSSAVYDVRGVAANGLRVNCGFERVPNAGTGYNVRDLASQFGSEFLVPTVLWIRLTAQPPVLKNLVFAYDAPAKLATALDKLTRSGRTYLWANVYDDRTWVLVRGGTPPGPLVLEVGVGGTEGMMPARTKALDTSLAGFTVKSEAPAVWGGPTAAYAERSAKLAKQLFVGELVTAAKNVGTAIERLRGLGESKGVRAGFFGSAMATGQAYLSPYFEAAREPLRTYDLSRGTWDVARGMSDSFLDSRLAHLWNEDPYYQRRVGILQKLEAALDMPNAIEPSATLEREPVDLFPGEQ